MATKTVSFQKSRYYSLHPHLDETFVRHLLFPELKKQGKLGMGSPGIELPTGEFITLSEAKELIFDFLINQANLGESDQRALRGVTNHTSFVALADSYLNREVVEPRTLGATITPDQIVSLQTSKTKPRVNNYNQFVASDRIHEYNELYKKILQYSHAGNSAQILSRLFPSGIGSATDITQLQLAQVIVSNLVRLREANNASENQDVQNYAVAQEFSRILSNHPELEGYRNFLGNSAIQATLRQYVDSVASQAEQNNPLILQEMDRLQLAYGLELKTHLLNESELRTQIYNSLPLIRDNERLILADQILRGITSGSRDGTSLDQVLAELKLDQNTQTQVYTTLHNQGIEVSLNYYQGKLRLQLDSHELTRGEIKLLKKGLNPFLTTLDPHKNVLVEKETDLLETYNSKTTSGKHFITLQEAYINEQQKTNPDPLFLIKARDILNRQHYYDSLSPQERRQVESTRFGRWFSNTTSRISNIQDKFIDSTYDLVDTITSKKWLLKQWDHWDVIAAKVYIPGTKIPLFRINSWVARQFESWKKVRIKQFSTTSSSWSSPFGKWIHRRASDYELGDLTLKGMTYVGLHRAWSNLAYKASGKIIKGGLIISKRTFTRLLIKIGGKALAKIGLEAITTLSGVFTAVGILLIVKDVLELVGGVIKWGWEQLKKVFGSAEGAAAAVITGSITAITGALAAGTTFILGLLSPLILPAMVTAALVFSITLGGLYLFTHQGDGFNMSIRLDSNSSLTQLAANIVCSLTSAVSPEGSSNPKLAAGKCVFELLSKAGINPLNRSNAAGPAFASFSTGLGNGAASEEAKRSATDYATFQCVGFDVVVSMMTGGGGEFSHAKFLDTIEPSGYRFVAGVGSCSPGDFFVDKNGAWGHTGLFVENAGANIVCLDANSDGLGTVRDETTCRWPTSAITGCLKSN